MQIMDQSLTDFKQKHFLKFCILICFPSGLYAFRKPPVNAFKLSSANLRARDLDLVVSELSSNPIYQEIKFAREKKNTRHCKNKNKQVTWQPWMH